MIRTMYDAMGTLAHFIPNNPEMVAGYDTGTKNILWTSGEWGMFPRAVHVHINQGYQPPARNTSTVLDVESGAWQPGAVITQFANMEANGVQRPTLYCSQNTILELPKMPKVYDMWLAWPGYTGTDPPEVPGWNVVAVQYLFPGDYDVSAVYDPWWPDKPPAKAKETNMISGQLIVDAFIPFPSGSFSRIDLYRDWVNDKNVTTVRVAVHETGIGYHIHNVPLTATIPTTITFSEISADAISLVRTSGPSPVGYTIS